MKKTEHYQLNQWEASDRIRMEDFNADNQRLEAALLGVLCFPPRFSSPPRWTGTSLSG